MSHSSNTDTPEQSAPETAEFKKAKLAAAIAYKEQCKIDRDGGALADCDFKEGAEWAQRYLRSQPSSNGEDWEKEYNELLIERDIIRQVSHDRKNELTELRLELSNLKSQPIPSLGWVKCSQRFPEDWITTIIRHIPTKEILTEEKISMACDECFIWVISADYDRGSNAAWRHIDKTDCFEMDPLQDTPSLPKQEGEYTLMEAVEFALSIRDLWAADQVGTVSADHEGEMQALSKMEKMFKSAFLLTPAFCPSPKQEKPICGECEMPAPAHSPFSSQQERDRPVVEIPEEILEWIQEEQWKCHPVNEFDRVGFTNGAIAMYRKMTYGKEVNIPYWVAQCQNQREKVAAANEQIEVLNEACDRYLSQNNSLVEERERDKASYDKLLKMLEDYRIALNEYSHTEMSGIAESVLKKYNQ